MNLTTDQQHILKVMSSGANVFLSGASGTEKSHLISKFIGENSDKNIIICSPASSADENYAGDTLRGIFGVPGGVLKIGNYNAKPCDALKRADIIIIEKINMCRIDVFEYAVRTLRNLVKRMSLTSDAEHYKKQIILAGDFYKAPPILRKEDKKAFVSEWGFKRETDLFAFNSSLWEELALESVILEDSMHSDNASKSAIICVTDAYQALTSSMFSKPIAWISSSFVSVSAPATASARAALKDVGDTM